MNKRHVNRQMTTVNAIEAYLKRCTKDRLLVISRAVADVQADLAECELTDEELAQLIALHAVTAGFTMISFDLKARRYTIELPVAWSVPGWPILGSTTPRRRATPAVDILPDPDSSKPPAGN